jgi:glutamyl-tRNA synthetase
MRLGIDIARARIRQAISILGGISKKQAKALEKEFRNF